MDPGPTIALQNRVQRERGGMCVIGRCHGRAQRRTHAGAVGAAVITPVLLLCGAHLLPAPRAPTPS